MLLGLVLIEGKIPTCTSKQRRIGNVIDSESRRELNKFENKDFLSVKCQLPS